MNWLRFRQFTILCAALLSCSSCSFTYEVASSDFFNERERLDRAAEGARSASRAFLKRVASDHPELVDQEIDRIAQLHFERANEMAKAHFTEYDKISDTGWFKTGRRLVVSEGLSTKPSLLLFSSPRAAAFALPTGEIVLSDALVRSTLGMDSQLSPVLLGVLVHELIHVYDAHALEHWMSSVGRIDYAVDAVKSTLGSILSIVPGMNIAYRVDYSSSFPAASLLPGLSEFAADLGARLILQKNSYPFEPYLAFLRSAGLARAGESRALRNLDQWSGIAPRLDCQAIFNGALNLELDVVRLEERGVWIDIDIKKAKEFMSDSDNEVSNGGKMLLFSACSMERSFTGRVDRSSRRLTLPAFDLEMFLQYIAERKDKS